MCTCARLRLRGRAFAYARARAITRTSEETSDVAFFGQGVVFAFCKNVCIFAQREKCV